MLGFIYLLFTQTYKIFVYGSKIASLVAFQTMITQGANFRAIKMLQRIGGKRLDKYFKLIQNTLEMVYWSIVLFVLLVTLVCFYKDREGFYLMYFGLNAGIAMSGVACYGVEKLYYKM